MGSARYHRCRCRAMYHSVNRTRDKGGRGNVPEKHAPLLTPPIPLVPVLCLCIHTHTHTLSLRYRLSPILPLRPPPLLLLASPSPPLYSHHRPPYVSRAQRICKDYEVILLFLTQSSFFFELGDRRCTPTMGLG